MASRFDFGSPFLEWPRVKETPAVWDDSDAALVNASQQGHTDAFGQLYQRYARMVHGILLAKVPRAEVEDLVHDVFLRALPRLRSFHPARPGATHQSFRRAHRAGYSGHGTIHSNGSGHARPHDPAKIRPVLLSDCPNHQPKVRSGTRVPASRRPFHRALISVPRTFDGRTAPATTSAHMIRYPLLIL
jgi:hypothetical protein